MSNDMDNSLFERFQQEIWNKVPHREEKDGKVEIVNATPLTLSLIHI